VYLIALRQQELSQVRAILTGDTGDECFFHNWITLLLEVIGCTLFGLWGNQLLPILVCMGQTPYRSVGGTETVEISYLSNTQASLRFSHLLSHNARQRLETPAPQQLVVERTIGQSEEGAGPGHRAEACWRAELGRRETIQVVAAVSSTR
jgi:hypothetical protein